MLEDPTTNVRSYGFQREVCDPVENIGYYVVGDMGAGVRGMLVQKTKAPG
jgi:hypothetical protein